MFLDELKTMVESNDGYKLVINAAGVGMSNIYNTLLDSSCIITSGLGQLFFVGYFCAND